jgi:hypothetical protein
MRRRDVLLAATLLALPRGARADAEELHDDTVARWLAGTSVPAGFRPTGEWLAYAAAEDERWALTGSRLRAMLDWSKRELAPLIPHDRALLYPFSGPDALHALALFDDAPHLLLVGLEPVLAVPDPTDPARAGYFADLGAAMANLHRLTFFRTRELLPGTSRVGVLPALLVTLVRMGGRVVRVSTPANGRVSIAWLSSDDRARRLDYAQVDLSNTGLAKKTDFVATLRGLAPYVTFLKAASYLVGEDRFSYVRRLLLEDTAALVQDDTGIPFHDLDGRWAMRLFGRYVAPDEPFRDRVQPDLESAFARQAPSPLPFGIGYHVFPRSSNLLVAARLPR